MYQKQKKIETYLIDDNFMDWASKNPIDETAFEEFDGIENAPIVRAAFEIFQLLQLKEKNVDTNLIQVEKLKLLNSIDKRSKQKTASNKKCICTKFHEN